MSYIARKVIVPAAQIWHFAPENIFANYYHRRDCNLNFRVASALAVALSLAACATPPQRAAVQGASTPVPIGVRPNYLPDSAPDIAPQVLENTPDAIPRYEPLHAGTSRPYVVAGRQYVPEQMISARRETGMASWYGRKYHGQPTAIGEPYDMYAMTAAHPTAPLPSYARVTNLSNRRSAVLRLNDRGPFSGDRIIDVSYAAAAKLGFASQGSAMVEVELLDPANAGQPGRAAMAPSEMVAALPQTTTVGVYAAPLQPTLRATPITSPAAISGSTPVAIAPTIAATPPAAMVAPMVAPLERVAASSAVPITATTTTAVPTGDNGYFVQLGAFANTANATAFLNQVTPVVSQQLGVSPQLNEQAGLLRVRVGPYATREAAAIAAQKLRASAGLNSAVGK